MNAQHPAAPGLAGWLEIKPMRSPLPLLSCLALLASPALPALAQPRPAAQPVSLGLPPEDPEKASIGAVDARPPECRPIYGPGIHQLGPATAEPEKQTWGMVVAGVACEAGR